MINLTLTRAAPYSSMVNPLASMALSLPDYPFSVKRPDVDLAANLKRVLDELSNVEVPEESRNLSRSLLAVHGTFVDNLPSILESGKILPYRELSNGFPSLKLRLSSATDLLDRSLGLDRYAFFSIGRTHPFANYDLLICYPNSIGADDESLIATREIVHHGGIVSKESAAFQSLASNEPINPLSIASANDRAAKSFFSEVVRGNDYLRDVLPRIVSQPYFMPISSGAYFNGLGFPGLERKILSWGDECSMRGAWEGPQLMRRSIGILDHNPIFLVLRNDKIVRELLLAHGVPRNDIFQLSHGLNDYMPALRKSVPDKVLKVPDRATMLATNLALADLTLIRSRREGMPHCPIKQVGFKKRD